MSTQLPQQDEKDEASIASAIQEITEKTQLLVKDEVELAKTEIQIKVKALGVGAGIAAAAGVFVLGALIMLLFGFAWLAFYALPFDNSVFVGFFFMAGVLLILAAVAGLVAKKFLSKGAPPVPQMAIDEGKKIKTTVDEARAAEVQR